MIIIIIMIIAIIKVIIIILTMIRYVLVMAATFGAFLGPFSGVLMAAAVSVIIMIIIIVSLIIITDPSAGEWARREAVHQRHHHPRLLHPLTGPCDQAQHEVS